MNRYHGFMIGVLCFTVLMSSGCGNRAADVSGSAGGADKEIMDVVTTPGKAEAAAAESPVSVKRSPLAGKKVSILGDSISTFTGYIPADYSTFYPENGGITNVGDTWWMRVINESQAVYCADASYSGSETCGLSTEQTDGRPGVGYRRLKDLTSSDGTKPDVVFVYMGANDLLCSRPIGDNDGTRAVKEGYIDNFSDAYSLMLDKIKVLYPNVKIYCITFHEICRWDDAGKGCAFKSNIGLVSSEYDDRIKIIAKNKGIPVLDVYDGCGIDPDTARQLTLDGTHPNAQGAAQIANCILRDISSLENDGVK